MDFRKKLFGAIIFLPLLVQAQESRTTKSVAKDIITDKFPTTRFIDFEYEYLTPSDFTSKIYDEKYEKGRMADINRARLSLNFPVYRTRKLVIVPSIRYRYETIKYDNMVFQSNNYPHLLYNGKQEEHHYIAGSLNATYFSKIWGKHTVFNLNVMGDGSDEGFERMGFSLMGVMVLKKDSQTSMSAGLIAIIEKGVTFPIIPTFSYERKFSGSPWILDIALPRYTYMRRPIASNGRLSLGVLFDDVSFYGYPKFQNSSDTYRLTKSELKVGFLYEHLVNKHFILSLKSGGSKPVIWKTTKKSSRKSIVKYSSDINMYFSLGVSYNL